MKTIFTFSKLTIVFLLVAFFCSSGSYVTAQRVAHNVTLQLDYTHPSTCANSKDGYIQVNGWGGDGAIKYSIDNGVTFQTDRFFRNLAVGTYRIIAQDGDGCRSVVRTATVGFSRTVNLSVSYVQSATCSNSKDGHVELNGNGGTGQVFYSIDNGVTFQTDKFFRNLGAGKYNFIAKDADGCISPVVTAQVNHGAGVKIQEYYQEDYNCGGWGRGRKEFGAVGGVQPYSYFLNGNPSANIVNGLPVGKHVITVVDAVGCSDSKEFTIEAPYTATLTGDATVRPNENFALKVTISDNSASRSTLYTVKGKDNLGNSYTYSDLKVGENERVFTTPVSLVFTILSIERQDASKCKGFVSGTATITVKEEYVWTGAESSDWHTKGNWQPAKVPTSTSEVSIPQTVNKPVINENASAKSITIEKGASLEINSTLHLTETISAYQKHSVDASKGTLNYTGTSLQQIDGGIFKGYRVMNIIVGNDIRLLDSVYVYGNIRFSKINKTFQTNDLLTLKSTESGTASVDKVINGNKITGKVTVEHYVPAKKGWKFLSISTQPGQTINQAWQEGQPTGNTTNIQGYGIQLTGTMADWQKQGYDAKSPAPSIKTYNSNTNLWVGVPSTHAPFNHPSNAYMVFVRGDRSANAVTSPETPTVLRSKGELKTGDQPVVTVTPGQFIAVGNPYPADIDLSKINASNDMFYYMWDQHLGNSYGAYQVFMRVAKNEFMAIPGGGTYESVSENIIPAGQAFFAYHLNGGTLQITENSKVSELPSFGTMRGMAPSDFENNTGLKLRMFSVHSGNEKLVDGIYQNIGEAYSHEIDQYDAFKSSNTGENLAIKKAGKLLSIESMSLSENADTTVLNISGVSISTYRFKAELNKSLPNIDAFLVDNFTKNRTIIRSGIVTEYEFQVTNAAASYAPNRFTIVYAPQRAMPVTFTSIKAEKNNDKVNVSWTIEEEVNVASYSVERSQDGTRFNEVGKVSANGQNQYRFIDNNPAAGMNYYRIVSTDLDGKKGYSSTAKVTMDVAQEQISVQPNPIVGNTVNLQVKLQAKGIYYISIKNQLGQHVENKQISYDGGQTNFTLNPSVKLSHGVYTVEVTHPSGERSVVRFIK